MNEIDTDNVPTLSPVHTLAELCALAGLTPRTLRYYVQIGLVDRPIGETRAARYDAHHLEQVLLVKKWTAAGLSLERIRDLLHGAQAPGPTRPPMPGSVEVRSHLLIADGVELVIEPGRAGLSPQQLRQFLDGVMTLHGQLAASPTPSDKDSA